MAAVVKTNETLAENPNPVLDAHSRMMETLNAAQRPVSAGDLMAEAGRKVLVRQFKMMLEHEAGSRTGEDIEDVHDMRVATRRMRSAFHLLKPYFKPRHVHAFKPMLSRIAATLGGVRDLDVLLEDVHSYGEGLSDAERAHLQPLIARLEAERTQARAALCALLDKGKYTRFTKDMAKFLTLPKTEARPKADATAPAPSTLRHILPALIYSHVGQVRAYDSVLATASEETLHDLRIEFKRLRYAVSLFSEVLGTQIGDYIEELKLIQDHLGRMNDIATARARLSSAIKGLPAETVESVNGYLCALSDEGVHLRKQVDEMWNHFNRKSVQRQLASAIVAL